MKFIHITDIHLVRDSGRLNGGFPSQRLDACLNDIIRWHSDAAFCVISGDLAEFAEEEAYRALKARMVAFPLRSFLLIGNHDDRAVFQSVFPDHPKDANGFVQHRFETDEGVFLFLDSTKDGRDVHEGQLCPARLDWLRQQLILAQDKPTYVFLHHPPFDLGIPLVDEIRLVEADAFADALKHGHNIRHVFYGHVHRMTYVNWRGFPFTSLPSLNHQIPLNAASVDGEFCDEPPAYGVVQIGEDQLTVHFNTFLHRNPLHQT
ncbi:phosphodiesterase [Ruegeria sp. HKCCSP351]|uniref:phosphodiesterase n=1 Tax=Ruegeria sp. HKCCSP351 TaxID=2794832 RepID=UPI001AE5F236|nr:phosphodiesterase [Ruegeria sp. HKCCSP351]